MRSKQKDSSPWILGLWQDLGLFVLSPVWVIPLLWLAKSRFDPNGFGAVILAVGGTGHHLPGFIRAYTDPLLFRRFRARLILAPLLLFAVYALFFSLHLDGLKLILVFWGTWHGAMQVNGFLRIYDAKAGSFSKATSWLDRAMCVVWFGGALLYSSRLIVVLSHFFNAGGPAIPASVFVLFRNVWMVVAIAVSAAFAVNAWQQSKAGKRPSSIKFLMLASSVALWWFAMVGVSSLLVGVLLFEIVHDIQYNVLVWIYNRRRVTQGMTASRIERFLFQPNAVRGFLYLGLIVLYGALADILDYANVQAPDILQIGPGAANFWTGLFMVSTFLHFYFDGFIWQVREGDFRKGMGIGTSAPAPAPVQPMRWAPAAKWAFFLVPAALLGISQYRSVAAPLRAQAQNIVELLPDRWQANAVAGSIEKTEGSDDSALHHLQRAIALNPSYAYGETMLADIYAKRGEKEQALSHYTRSIELDPANDRAQASLGKLLLNSGHTGEALPHLKIAADRGLPDSELNYVLGASLVREKRALEGVPYLHRAVQLDPANKQALNYLGIAFQSQGDLKAAEGYYRRALAIDPSYAMARENLDRIRP